MAVYAGTNEVSYSLNIPVYHQQTCSLLEDIRKSSTPINGTKPVQYKLKFSTTLRHNTIIKCCVDYGRMPSRLHIAAVEKVIMVVGATGAGKSTLINGFANYLFGVKWEDNYRFRVIDETGLDQAVSQTKNITAYTFHKMEGLLTDYTLTIIDTPGFGDTSGISRDREISAQIRSLFSLKGSEGIDHINGVLFVTPAALPRLSATQLYVFEAILSIFGNDIKNNIFLMTTFADGQKPKVLSAIKKAEVPYNQFFKFNNSALFANTSADQPDSESDDEESFDQLSWKMGIKSFKNFFKKFDKIEAQSLSLTREVMQEREHLQIIMKDMPKKIMLGLSKIDELQQEEMVMRARESDVLANKDFKYTIKTTKQRKVDLKGQGVYVTNCLICNYTCHDNCAYADDGDKFKCSAMTYQGDINRAHCVVCTKKCGWRDHVNNPYRFELYEENEERTSEELRKRYEQATSDKSTIQQVIDGIKKELKDLGKEVISLIKQAKGHLQRLQEIALRPINLSEVDYIDLLIETERNEAKRGFMERIKALEGFRKQAELIYAMKDIQLNAESSVFEQLR